MALSRTRRFKPVALLLTLLVASILGAIPQPKVSAVTVFLDSYPNHGAAAYNVGAYEWWVDEDQDGTQDVTGSPTDNDELVSGRGYYYRNCTDGAAYWTTTYTGVGVSGWHNAENWDTAAASAGHLVYAGSTNSIEPGDIAQSDDGAAGYGHVGFVTSVTKNGNGVVTSFDTAELNKGGNGDYTTNTYSSRTTNGNFSRGSGNDWDHFIDVNGVNKGLNNEDIVVTDPDNDGDTVTNTNDPCPNIYGDVVLKGCVSEQKVEGDFNGDGYGDVLATSVGFDNSAMALYLYKGSATGLTGPDHQMNLNPNGGGWDFQGSKLVATNVNGDAYMDLVIFHKGPANEIARHVFKGSSTGLTASDPNMLTIEYPYQGWYWTNVHIVGAGDFNGDGYGDIAAVSLYPNGHDSVLYVYHGSSTGLGGPQVQRELVSWNGGWDYARMKFAATNVDGDSYTDLVIFHQGTSDEIARHVIKGSSTGLQTVDANMTVVQAQDWYWSNLRVMGAGDFNGDGYGDAMIGLMFPNKSDYALYLYNGSTTGLTPNHQFDLTANSGGWSIKKSKSTSTDVNGDGKTDLVIFHQGPVDEIARHVLKGSSAGITASDSSMLVIQYPYQNWLWSRVFTSNKL